MRHVIAATAIALLVLWTCVLAASCAVDNAPLKNGYWPFSVETSIRDK
jgi:hypothetical protein